MEFYKVLGIARRDQEEVDAAVEEKESDKAQVKGEEKVGQGCVGCPA